MTKRRQPPPAHRSPVRLPNLPPRLPRPNRPPRLPRRPSRTLAPRQLSRRQLLQLELLLRHLLERARLRQLRLRRALRMVNRFRASTSSTKPLRTR